MRTYVDVACVSCREMWSVHVDKLDPLGNWCCYKCCGDRKAPETPKAGGCHDPRPYNFKYTDTAPAPPPRDEWPKVKTADPRPVKAVCSNCGKGPEDEMRGCTQYDHCIPKAVPSPDDQMLADMSLQLDEAKQKLVMWQKKALAIQEESNDAKQKVVRARLEHKWVLNKLVEARLSKWARFKRWAKKQWEAEI